MSTEMTWTIAGSEFDGGVAYDVVGSSDEVRVVIETADRKHAEKLLALLAAANHCSGESLT